MTSLRGVAAQVVIALSLVWILVSPASGEEEWQFADMAMASINHVAITRNQIIQETRFILAEKKRDWAARLPTELLNSVLDRMIAKELIYQEIDRVGSLVESDSLIDGEKLWEAFGKHFAATQEFETFVNAIGLTRNSFIGLLIRNEKVERFIDRRLSLMSRVSEDEVKAALEARLASRNEPMEDARKRELAQFIRQEMERRKYDQAFSRWLDDLQGRNSVHRLARFTEDVPAMVVNYGD